MKLFKIALRKMLNTIFKGNNMSKVLEWTSNDICFDPATKTIFGQVTCNGSNAFKARAFGRDLGRFVDRQVAIDQVSHVVRVSRFIDPRD